ncbi:AraC family transcriptional regulator [Paenibacillus sp. J22TS3]|uniref:AraC family transcriptional regulator n=1 Tax=Paenibacillus sp. J22TS3 TaxID=2807192 RepID=UPI001B2C0C38|nr:AraC family transcriptional regulator [Paenibacillus sp. J22TS3]GIP22064.1 transcriptional regulator [Paenibacillus sp. J22TS3]
MPSRGISVAFLIPMMRGLLRKGYDWADFCTVASVDMNMLQDVESRLPEEEFTRIVTEAARYTGDELFGLHQGQEVTLSDLGVLGYVMMHSKTIGEALTTYQKYNMLACGGYNAAYQMDGEDIVIRLYAVNPAVALSRHCIEDMASSLCYAMKGLAGKQIGPKEVAFCHEPGQNINEYAHVFGVMPKFRQEQNILRMSQDIWDYPVLSSDSRLKGVFEAIAEEAKHRLIQGAKLTDKLYHWIIESMPARFPSLQEAAMAIRMSARSLQAKLKQEGTSYNRLANRVRRELALGYLANPEYNMAEIAYLLHFSEPSAFQSTFKKWMGISPGQYRLMLKERASSGEVLASS